MTFTQSSTRLAALTIGAAAIVAVAFSAASAAPALAASVCPGTTFSTNLKLGSHGASVMALQQFLNTSADTQVAATGAGSPGNETSTFGGLTKAAVNKFQVKYAAQVLTPVGLTTPTGNFFASTRAQASAVCAGTTGTTGTTGGTTTGGTAAGTAVVAAAAQPANTIAPKGAARVPFTAFTVTANGSPVTINSVTVQRQGPSVDTDFAGIVLIDASTGVQVGNSRVLDANHNATIGSAITIPAGSSKTFWVAGNISTTLGASGDIASFAVTAVNTASTVSASYPIVGASNTLNASLVIGTAQISNSSFDPNSASTQSIGATGYRFSGIKVNAGSTEDVTFKSITWYNAGSASGLQNVMTVVNGTSYPTTLDSTGRYFTTVFPNGIVITKGNSVDAYVQADLGANATAATVAEFDIYRNTDIYIVGNQYGYGITPTLSAPGTVSTDAQHASFFGTNTGNPFFQGSTVTVQAGTFSTIQNATSVGAQNIATNVTNQPLGGFQTNLTGEGITVQSLKVTLTTSADLATTTSVSLVNENGATVAGPFDSVWTGLDTQTVTFTGSIDFPVGTHTYTLKGKVGSTAANGTTIQASTNPSTDWSSVTGDTSGNNVTPTIGNFTMNTMTVQGATLSVSNGTTPTSGSTIVAGGQNVLLATVQLDASQSGEDVRLSSVPVTITTDSAGSKAFLSSCQISNGATVLNTGSRVINASNITGATTAWATTFSFDNSLTIPKGTVMNLPITCNISSSAPTTTTYAIAPTNSIAPTGVTSGSTITVSVAGTAPTIMVSTGAALAGSTDSSSPSTVIVAGGTSGVLANVIKFRSTNEAVNLQKVGLRLANNSTAVADVTTAYLYAGNNIKTTAGVAVPANTLIGTVTFSQGSATATSTLSTSVQLPADQDATILVKADLAAIGTNKPGHEADTVTINYDSARGVGANSGKTVDGTGTAATSLGLRTFASYPIVAAGPTAPANPSGVGQVLKKFSVAASTAGGVGLNKIAIAISTSSLIGVTNVKLIANTNSDYTGPANVPGTSSGIFGAAVPTFASGDTLVFSQSGSSHAPLEIGTNSTIYFTLVGDVSVGTSNGSWTINATVLGDASADSLKVPAAITGNFIWSGNATSTATATDYDWANGANVQGLSSTGF